MINYRVSIVLATFNGEKYIREQLISLSKQTVQAFEIIICDDLSSDNTISIIKEFSSALPIKLFVNNFNLGVNKNFEKAIEICCGDFIAICDQDDIWFDYKIETLLQEILRYDSNHPLLIRSNSFKMNSDMSLNQGLVFPQRQPYGLYKRFFHPFAQGAGMFFNKKLKDLLLPFPNGIFTYDFYIAMTAEIFGLSFFYRNPLMFYRIHQNNAVGMPEKYSISARIRKALKKDYSVYVPDAFITLSAMLSNNRFHYEEKTKIKMQNILSINSTGISKKKKIQLLFHNNMGTNGKRIVLALKIILLKN